MSCDILFVSAEASGDDLVVSVVRTLRSMRSDININAVGGSALEEVGLVSPVDISPLSVVGLIEGLRVYSKAVKLADQVTEFVVSERPKAVVLVDSWGFTLRVAQRIRKQAPDIKLIKMVGPQVWATRAGRAKTLASTVDHLLCIHDFETPFYEPFNLPTTVIGNPALDRLKQGDGAAFRKRYQVSDSDELLLVLPGSRSSEIKRVAPVLARSAFMLSRNRGHKLKTFVLTAGTVRPQLDAAKLDWPEDTVFITQSEEKADLMSAGTLALACSGTVTTELGTQGCPMVVGYKLGWITWVLAVVILFKARFATLMNVAVDKEVAPELIQLDFTVGKVVSTATHLLDNPELLSQQISEQFKALRAMGMGGKPAHQVAAESILAQI